ncbi:multidrug effflux MFS transporter [Streptomyces sp. HB2AG]|uniref:multidrug effflux MFS transporter n=1 Tax=Streptomyces sp. HB2AG TaxID=2983400 RepID=UPI0022AB0436|nr:multidrug effflux MFS transporter [Streptomyces sp. HB2AG]MCZ2525191.1 multidrug effflux MFS transporter [Streptomyces sp. HB2AG]
MPEPTTVPQPDNAADAVSGTGASGPAAVPPAAGPSAPGLSTPRPAGLLVTLILGGLTALGPLSMDMYLPSLPQISETLHSPVATVQLTLTACLLGMALGQLVAGPMSDRWGRRRPLLTGLVVYVLATAGCALAPTAEILIGVRLLQGLAGAAGIVIARAVVRDLYSGLEMARFFSTLMLISGTAPILAPAFGGQVMHFADWRGIFAVLALIGVVLVVLVARWLHETLPHERRHDGGIGQSLRTMRDLFADRVFSGYLLTASFGFAALFAYVAASSFVIQKIYGASPQTYSLLFGLNSVGLIAVGQINGKILVGRVRLDRALAFGLVVTVAAAAALVLMTSGAFGAVGLAPVAAGLFVLMSAMGLVMPNSSAQALMRTPHAAGSASALLGTSQFLVGAVASALVGLAGEHTAVPMAAVQLACGAVAVLSFVALVRPWRRHDADGNATEAAAPARAGRNG